MGVFFSFGFPRGFSYYWGVGVFFSPDGPGRMGPELMREFYMGVLCRGIFIICGNP